MADVYPDHHGLVVLPGNILDAFGDEARRIFLQNLEQRLLLLAGDNLGCRSESDRAFVFGRKFSWQYRGLADNAERDCRVGPNVVEFPSFGRAVKIEALVGESVMQGNRVGPPVFIYAGKYAVGATREQIPGLIGADLSIFSSDRSRPFLYSLFN